MLLILLSIARATLPIIVVVTYLLYHLFVYLVVTLRSAPAHDLLTHLADIMDILDDPMLLHVLHKALLLSGSNCGLGDCGVLYLKASTEVGLLITHLHIVASIQYPTEPSQLLLCSSSPTSGTPVLVDHPLYQISS